MNEKIKITRLICFLLLIKQQQQQQQLLLQKDSLVLLNMRTHKVCNMDS